nr:IS30 family transposase [Streptomyces sp. NRRL F-5123]
MVKQRYFELLRTGYKGAAAARVVGYPSAAARTGSSMLGACSFPTPALYRPASSLRTTASTLPTGSTPTSPSRRSRPRSGKSFQTVYREIRRNSKPDGHYNPWWAHNQALLRRKRPKEEKIRAGEPLRTLVREKLTDKWSPQQIARYLAREYADDAAMRACPETIYRALFAGLLGRRDAKLRTGRTRRKKQRRGVPTPNKIKNMTLIHHRPLEINDRKTPGHWEGDLIIGRGQGSAIGTLVERTTRYVQLIHLPRGRKAPQVRNALITQTAHIPPQLRKSLTWDQGRELTLHEEIEALTGFRIYFCEPHSPWQRGTNENTNGLLRQYFPKGTDLSLHTARDLHEVARQLNRRPRMVLGDKTPAQAMQEWLIDPLTR